MNNLFVKEESKVFPIIIAIILMIPTLGLPIFGAYELFFQPHYWKNRWTLYRMFKKGKVKVMPLEEYEIYGERMKPYQLTIGSETYSTTIWGGSDTFLGTEKMTLEKVQYGYDDYIGLFIGSPITKWLNRKTIKMLYAVLKNQVSTSH